jgi:hypothetical protein
VDFVGEGMIETDRLTDAGRGIDETDGISA